MRLAGRLINYFSMMVIGFLLGGVFLGYLLDDNSHFWTMFFLIVLMVVLVVLGELIDKPEKEYIYIPHSETIEEETIMLGIDPKFTAEEPTKSDYDFVHFPKNQEDDSE